MLHADGYSFANISLERRKFFNKNQIQKFVFSSSSSSFQFDRTFELQPDVYVLGYTQKIIETFTQRYVHVGNQFHRLRTYVNQSSANQSETENNFFQSLRYFLRYVQNSFAIHDIKKYSLIKFAAQLDPIIRSLT